MSPEIFAFFGRLCNHFRARCSDFVANVFSPFNDENKLGSKAEIILPCCFSSVFSFLYLSPFFPKKCNKIKACPLPNIHNQHKVSWSFRIGRWNMQNTIPSLVKWIALLSMQIYRLYQFPRSSVYFIDK